MKHLIRRLSRVGDPAQYTLLRSESGRASGRSKKGKAGVPQGHVPVYVGEEMERFVVRADVLNHQVFIGLLKRSAEEYGYEQKGVLRIPCNVLLFQRIMESLRLGVGVGVGLGDSSDVQEQDHIGIAKDVECRVG